MLAFLRNMCLGLGFISIFKSNGCVRLLRSINYGGIYKLYKHFRVVLGSPSVMPHVHPVHTHLFWHTESSMTDDTAKVSDWPFPAVYVQRLTICTDKRGVGQQHIGFWGMLEGVSTVTFQDRGCLPKELEKIRYVKISPLLLQPHVDNMIYVFI